MTIRCPNCDEAVATPLPETSFLTCPRCGGVVFQSGAETVSEVQAGLEETGTLGKAQRHSKGVSTATKVSVRPPPRIVGDYELIAEIAHGGMGVVYKARQISLNRMVAVKLIKAGELADEREVRRFRAEAEAAANLDHPNIVPVYEVGEHQGQHYFSMGLVKGRSLKQLVGDGPLAVRDAATLVATIAEAVAFAHRQGIVHRDLKPSNVLIDGDGRPKVTDFGLAKNVHIDDSLTETGQVLGTPDYMPPEQAAGRIDRVGPLSDVYSLGAILYCLLSGRPPFRAGNVVETLQQVINTEPLPPRRLNRVVSRDLETICLKCLRKEPFERYESAQALADDLRRYLDRKPIKARPVSFASRTWRWCRRNPFKASVAAAVFTASLAFLIYWNTRPAYLNLSVSPADASVTLDGIPIELVDGHQLFEGSPGRHELEISAPGCHAQQQSINLVRGRSNEAILNIALKSSRGHLQIDSIPTGAKLRIHDSNGRQVDTGTTLYRSELLSAGVYTAELRRELYEPRRVKVTIPDGERTSPLETVELKPRKESESYLSFHKRLDVLNEPVGDWNFTNTSVQDVIDFAAESQKVRLIIDYKALEHEGISLRKIRWNAEFARKARNKIGGFAPETKLPFGAAISLILEPLGLTIVPEGGNPRLFKVTTRAWADNIHMLVVFPIGDLTDPEGRFRFNPRDLVNYIKNITSAPWFDVDGTGGTLQILPNSSALSVRNTWRCQIQVFDLLQEIRKSGGKLPAGAGRKRKAATSNNGQAKPQPETRVLSERPFRWVDSRTSPTGYSLHFLRVSAGASFNALNNKGEIVGSSLWWMSTKTRQAHATLWRDGVEHRFNTPAKSSYATSINDSGQFVGIRFGSLSGGFLSRDGRNAETVGGWPTRINSPGHVTGWLRPRPKGPAHAFVYREGKLIDLGLPTGAEQSFGTAINDRGQIVGRALYRQGKSLIARAFLYENGTMGILETLPGANARGATDINNKGQIVGWALLPSGKRHAFLRDHDRVVDLGTLPGFTNSWASAINERGQIVGRSTPSGSTEQHAVLFANGKVYDLHPRGWERSWVMDINDHGWIIGTGLDAWKRLHTFLLKPVKGQKPLPADRIVHSPVLLKAKRLFFDEFQNPQSGFRITRGGKGSAEAGYRGGRYYIHISKGPLASTRSTPQSVRDFACEIVGRVLDEKEAAWGIELNSSKHPIRITVSVDGLCSVAPGIGEAKKSQGPHRLGPHPAIKVGEVFNKLLVIVRGRQLEVYVNGTAVFAPVPIDRDYTPAKLMLTLSCRKSATAEFERMSVYSTQGLPDPFQSRSKN